MKEKTIIAKNLKQDALEDMNQFESIVKIVDIQRFDGSFEGWFWNFTSMWARQNHSNDR